MSYIPVASLSTCLNPSETSFFKTMIRISFMRRKKKEKISFMRWTRRPKKGDATGEGNFSRKIASSTPADVSYHRSTTCNGYVQVMSAASIFVVSATTNDELLVPTLATYIETCLICKAKSYRLHELLIRVSRMSGNSTPQNSTKCTKKNYAFQLDVSKIDLIHRIFKEQYEYLHISGNPSKVCCRSQKNAENE